MVSTSTDVPAFHVMAKPVGAVCNLACKYCFYLEKENMFPENNIFEMSDEVLESFIHQKIEAHKVPVVTFAWQGGEPTLLGVDYFRKVVELQRKYAGAKRIENTFQTNGILLNDDWCSFFKENNFLVGLSIDGPKEIHDKYRINKGGKGTFDEVMKGIFFLKKHNVDFNTLTVVHCDNSKHPIEIYNFLKEAGSSYMQFVPIVERIEEDENSLFDLANPNLDKKRNVTEWSVIPEEYGDFLIKIFEEWVRNDVGRYFVQSFDVALESWVGYQPGLCVFARECGTGLAIEHNGDLYSCDHYVYPENKLGNIMTTPLAKMVNSTQQVNFGMAKADLHPECKKCEFRFACNGDCPKHRFVKTEGSDKGISYLCVGYRKFFKYIDPYMKYMVNELQNNQSPGTIMEFLKRNE